MGSSLEKPHRCPLMAIDGPHGTAGTAMVIDELRWGSQSERARKPNEETRSESNCFVRFASVQNQSFLHPQVKWIASLLAELGSKANDSDHH